MVKPTDAVQGAAAAVRELSAGARRAPLLFSLVACVVSICATVVVVYWLSTSKPITQPEVEALIRTHFGTHAMTKGEFRDALAERDRTVGPATDGAMRGLAVKIDAVLARVEQESSVAAEARSDARRALERLTERVDRIYERLPAAKPTDRGAAR